MHNLNGQHDDTTAARLYFEEMLKKDPASSYACLGLGDLFFKEENYTAAKTMLEWAVVNDNYNFAAHEALSKVNNVLDLPEDDNSLIEPQPDNDLQSFIDVALELFKQEKFDEALQQMQVTESLFHSQLTNTDDPKFATSFYNFRGYIYFGLNDIENAKLSFEKALNLNPESSQACNGLGEVFYIRGLQSAREMFQWALRLNTENKSADENLKKVNKLLNLPEDDFLTVEEPVQLNDFDQVFDYVYTLYEGKKYKEAIELLNKAEQFLPEGDMKVKSAMESLKGFAYLGLNNLEDAKYFFERALNDEPDSSDACAGLGEIFYLSGMGKEAKTMFEWAITYNPGNNFAKQGLSKVNTGLGFEDKHNTLVEEFN